MNRHIHNVVSGRIEATDKMIQIKRKKRKLAQMEGIEEVPKLRCVGDIGVAGDQNIVEMKRIIERWRE